MATGAGRPRLASREIIQEAAFELFQHKGYRNTTVEQIAKVAGFSRATFFNFFSSKTDLFWLETDQLVASLRSLLEVELTQSDPAPLPVVLSRFAESLHSSQIPWALQNYELLEAADDLVASGASRVLGLNRLFAKYLSARSEYDQTSAHSRRAQAAATTAVLVTSLLDWIDAGVRRGGFGEFYEQTRIH